MEKGEFTNYLVDTLISVAELHNATEDKFFSDKLRNKLYTLLSNSVNWLSRNQQDIVQHRILYERVGTDIDGLLEVLDNICYINLVGSFPLFLGVQKKLLTLKLQIIKKEDDVRDKLNTDNQFEVKQEKETNKKFKIEKVVIKNINLNQSKKRIFDFIKAVPNTRTKDIISEFNALSDRTVKRNLTDLLHAGLIKKRIDNKAVYYYVE